MSRNDAREKGFFGRHKELEAQLKQCRAEFKILFDNISSGVAVYEARSNGEDFIFTDFNSAAEKIEHVKKEQLIGKSVLEVFPGVTEFGLFAVFQRVWKTGVPEYHPVSTYKDERIAGWRENYVFKLPSGEIRLVPLACRATIGQLSNVEHENVSLGKAGRKRWLGRRPHTRGVAMNPVDHPLGGGEGKSSGGRHPCSPWGVPTKGYKTRKPKESDRYIIKRRK